MIDPTPFSALRPPSTAPGGKGGAKRARRTTAPRPSAKPAVLRLEEREVPAALFTGTVFLDTNSNGRFDTLPVTINNAGFGTTTLTAETPYSGSLDPYATVANRVPVRVTAYNDAGTVAGTADTAANGTYTLTVASGGAYRLEFTNLPTGVGYGPSGVQSGTSVQFVGAAEGGTTGGVNLGLVRQEDVTPDNPLLVENSYVFGAFNGPNADRAVLSSFPYNSGSSIPDASADPYKVPDTHVIAVKQSSLGTTWGLAYSKSTNVIYSAAYTKRHTGYGPGTGDASTAQGEIYLTSATPAAGQTQVTTAAPFVNLAQLAPGSAGTNYRTTSAFTDPANTGGTDPYLRDGLYSVTGTDGVTRQVGWDAVGKTGLGGLDTDPSGRYLYAIALGDRKLYVVDTQNPTAAPQSFDLPVPAGVTGVNVGSNGRLGDLRPFAVQFYRGSVYVGAVNTGESTATAANPNGDASSLHAYVFQFKLTTDAAGNLAGGGGSFVGLTGAATTTGAILDVPLNYQRGYVQVGSPTNIPNPDPISANWRVWTPTFRTLTDPTGPIRNIGIYPQPMLTGLAFDTTGNLTLGFRDRAGDQFGVQTPADANNLQQLYTGITGGDTLRAFANVQVNDAGAVTSRLTLENNGQGPNGTPVSAQGVGDNQGPGGGEFYSGDYLLPGIYTGTPNPPARQDHQELSVGGVLQLPGYADVAVTTFDPAQVPGRYNSGGVRWYANGGTAAGDSNRAYELYQSDVPTPAQLFAKANGVGDLIAVTAAPVEIGNRLWYDANRNGIQDASETGLAGVQVVLFKNNAPLATATTDSAGNYYFTSLADPGAASGLRVAGKSYGVAQLTPNMAYEVRVPTGQAALAAYSLTTTKVNGGANPTTDSDATLVGANAVAATTTPAVAGPADHTTDIGFVSQLSLGDLVWNDLNNDGRFDGAEPALANVLVQLLNADTGAVIATQRTNELGGYLFQNLTPNANYRVRIPLDAATNPVLGGFKSSTGAQGSPVGPVEFADGTPVQQANNTDSGTTDPTGAAVLGPVVKATPGTARTGETSAAGFGDRGKPDDALTADANSFRDEDFGFFQPLSLGDKVWIDANNNGTFDAGEPGVQGVAVQLLSQTGAVLATTTTNANGGYLFQNLGGGTYQVRLVRDQVLAGYVSSTGAPGVTGPFEPVTANTPNDKDHGTQSAGFITGPQVALASGAAPATDPATSPAGLPDDSFTPITSRYRDQDFGVYQPVELGNLVFEDINNDGVRGAGEPGIAGVTLQLLDGAGSPILNPDGTPVVQTTDADGFYLFRGLTPGTYSLRFVPPAGYVTSTGGAGTPFEPGLPGANPTDNADHGTQQSGTSFIVSSSVVVGPTGNPDTSVDGLAGRANLRQDFGIFRPLVLGDLVFIDTNNSGMRDPGEPGLANVAVNLLNGSGQVIASTTTNAAGNYLFTGLTPGTYQVQIVKPAGYSSSTGGAGSPFEPAAQSTLEDKDKGTDLGNGVITAPQVTLGLPGSAQNPSLSGLGNLTQDFGLFTPTVPPPPPAGVASISGSVFVDTNANGAREAGEPPIPGTRVYLDGRDDAGNRISRNALTDANGNYSFTGLPQGLYTVREQQPEGTFLDGVDFVGTVGGNAVGTLSNDQLSAVRLLSGDAGINYNFSEIPTGALFGYTWLDSNNNPALNRNGVFDAGETPIPGVTVTISGTVLPGTAFARPLVASDVPGGLSTTTNSVGRYDFTNLPFGTYSVAETQPTQYVDWQLQDGDPNPNRPGLSSNLFSNVAVSYSEPVRGPLNFGETVLSISERNPGSPVVVPPTTAPSKRDFLASQNTSGSVSSGSSTSALNVIPTPATPGVVAPVGSPTTRPTALGGVGVDTPTYVAIGAAAGSAPLVRVLDYSTGLERSRFLAYEENYTGGVRTAVGDIDGDGVPDIVTATGVGGGPRIRVISGQTGLAIADFFAYEPTYFGGLSVAVADVNGDGYADIITGTDAGGGPRVRVFDGRTLAVIADYFAFDPAQRGGVRVAAADFNKDGKADIVATTGAGVPTRVRVFDGATQNVLRDFAPLESTFTGGLYVAAADLNGDGVADIVTGADVGGGPRVSTFDGATGSPLNTFFAYESSFTGGVRVAAVDLTGTGRASIVTAPGSGGGARVVVFSGAGTNVTDDFLAFDATLNNGLFVGAGQAKRKVLASAGDPSATGVSIARPGTLPAALS